MRYSWIVLPRLRSRPHSLLQRSPLASMLLVDDVEVGDVDVGELLVDEVQVLEDDVDADDVEVGDVLVEELGTKKVRQMKCW